ncbi:MAG TPA: response regulator [Rudaea sp.]|nr:response regulator [Rudaea sp.]
MPSVLIADDDPVSLRFLQTALEALGCGSIAAPNGVAAISAIGSNTFDLLMLDLHMPDTDGCALLRALRAREVGAPAIATSAELDPAIEAVLRVAGFADTLLKPASLDSIEQVLRRHVDLPGRDCVAGSAIGVAEGALPILDDASAMAAIGGDRTALCALRGLFARELDTLETDLRMTNAPPEPATLGSRLHRLRASSGFCGAAALGDAALRLQQAMNGDADSVPIALAEFMQICRATQRALAARA